MDLISQTYKVLRKIKKNKTDGFSGLGLVFYDSSVLKADIHCDLRPNMDDQYKNYSIFDEKIQDFLLTISDYRNTMHDGFHFFNEKGQLTHLAQYFVPPIVKDKIPDNRHGVRLYSSLCGSIIDGVLFVATICSDGDIYIYRIGDKIDLEEYTVDE